MNPLPPGRWPARLVQASACAAALALALLLVTGHAIAYNQSLDPSTIAVSQATIAPGEKVTVTITLRNTANETVMATVVAGLSRELAYVPGSASGGGRHIEDGILWQNVPVAQGAAVPLTFQVEIDMQQDGHALAYIVADIIARNQFLERSVRLAIEPSGTRPGPDLRRSFKRASEYHVESGEPFTYTIQLVNTGGAAATVSVVDPVPAALNFVTGTATMSGTYDSATRQMLWSGVTVPAHDMAPLSFAVTGTVTERTVVANTATISVTGQTSFERGALVVLLPQKESAPNPLAASRKVASRRVVGSGDVLTYTIKLENEGESDATARVTDPVPAGLHLVPGSATKGGAYDPATGVVTWSDIAVPEDDDGEVLLSFAVTGTVTAPTTFTNTATIAVSGSPDIQRSAVVQVVPGHTTGDRIRPVVHGLSIDSVDVLTSPQVTLHISATDNVSVTQMYLREWQLETSRFPPHWEVVRSSGWIPFEAEHPWTLGPQGTLGPQAGTHFVGVWVADAAHNISHLDRHALDFASLLVPGSHVAEDGLAPYLVYYDAGVTVHAAITPTQGSAVLFGWDPGSRWWPDHMGATLTFTTTQPGTYLIGVVGRSAATYDLSITPAGGRPLAGSTRTAALAFAAAGPDANVATGSPVENPLNYSGLDPLQDPSTLDAPEQLPARVYLPLVVR